MLRFYLLPIEVNEAFNARGPKYFNWRLDPDPPATIDAQWAMMDYGFLPSALLVADVTETQHSTLTANTDVYGFPENLDAPVTDPTIATFFEGFNIPTDWLTPATTYRELLRQTAGMFQFNQRYGGISGGHSLFEAATLNTRLREMTTQERAWFDQTVASFGFDPATINQNARLRQLVKQAGDFWAGQTFYIGGTSF